MLDTFTQPKQCDAMYNSLPENPQKAAKIMNPLSLLIVPYNRVRHLIKETKHIEELEKTIATIREQHKNSKEKGMEHYERVYNASLYVLILEYDITILKNDALFSIRKWKKSFVARQIAMLLYEASNDLPSILGKEFRKSLNEIRVTDEELKKFNSVTKAINKFKNDHRNILQKLRNYVGAHRDNNAATQLQIIEEVDLLEIMDLAGNFYTSIRDLMPLMTGVILKMGDWRIIARHIKVQNLAS